MIINPISKSTKGLTPEIIVTAPSGSTLDIMQNSVVLQTYTLGSSETSHTFTVKSVGSYVVRGNKSGYNTVSKTVSVDAVGRYTCTIAYDNKLYLYNYGDECESVTGGWVVDSSYPKVTKNSSNMVLTAGTSQRVGGKIQMANYINATPYSKICYKVSTNSISATVRYALTYKDSGSWTTQVKFTPNLSSSLLEADISSDNSSINPQIRCFYYDGSGANATLTVHAIWLE